MLVASVVAVPRLDAGAVSVNGTLKLDGGFCFSPINCIVVGEDAATHGALVPLNGAAPLNKVSACQSDAKTVGVAVAAFEAENPGLLPTTTSGWRTALLSHANGGPYLSSWPRGDPGYYAIEVAGKATGTTTGDHVKTANGDVVVIAVSGGNRTYDATINPSTSCEHLGGPLRAGGTVSDAAMSGIAGIACPLASQTCYGVGTHASSGEVATINANDPSSPTITATSPVSNATSLAGIACPTRTVCIVVGDGPTGQGAAATITGGAIGAAVNDPHEALHGVACPTSTRCVAVGSDLSINDGVLVPIELDPLTIGAPVRVASTAALDGLQCEGSGACIAAGERVTATGSTGVLVPVTVTSAAVKPGSVQPVADTSSLVSVQCIGATACDAAGHAGGSTGIGVVVGVAHGRARTALRLPDLAAIDAIGCVRSIACYGFGVAKTAAGDFDQLPPTVTTATRLRVSAQRVPVRHVIALTASVTLVPLGGSVEFLNDDRPIAGCRAVPVRAGTTRCLLEFPRPAPYVLRAIYSGDAIEHSSVSASVVERVVPAP
jgi:hypothetical protein